ncbi:hypothetical protein AJ80_00085 [Polytolypa hystricis UAMH7299]|uniref:Zn(2)-C6 fungal-type domain-containing protein n=1 Tax=Polytolypa hystricis (strain UAMH7299) TaxID=1447883 RepID=A0A2B7Z3M0_POLH7|nr:hypothetical protein AJ80_00085 [Polytolypa hystricis UAMH7299]
MPISTASRVTLQGLDHQTCAGFSSGRLNLIRTHLTPSILECSADIARHDHFSALKRASGILKSHSLARLQNMPETPSPAFIDKLQLVPAANMDRSVGQRRQGPRSLSQPQLNLNNLAAFPSFVAPSPLSPEVRNTSIASTAHADQKVAIPRLQRPGYRQSVTSTERQRVSHACEPCRRRKSKCDGLQPICSRCRDQELPCFYADGKREKLKRQVWNSRNARTMAVKVGLYENLLVDLLPNQPPNIQKVIRNTLAEASALSRNDMAAPGEGTTSGDEVVEDEYSVFAAAGSPHYATAFVRPIGFIGKASAIRWLEEATTKVVTYLGLNIRELSSIQREVLNGMNDTPSFDDFNRSLLLGCSYFLEEPELTEFTVYGQAVDALQLPQKSTADLLVKAYFKTMHPLFPVLSEKEFMIQYRSYWQTSHSPNNSLIWISILNIVFALGAIHAHRVGASYKGLENDHLLYALRSRALSQEPMHMPDLPNMEHIQLVTISGMYFVASYQINRAWNLIGLGLRYAYARALHLVNTAPDITDGERELEVKVWQSLCSIERHLSLLTGRPSGIQDRFISARLPTPTEPTFASHPSSITSLRVQEQVTTTLSTLPHSDDISAPLWTTFIAALHLDTIVAEALVELYSPSTLNGTWARVQRVVSDLDRKVNQWRSEHVPALSSASSHNDGNSYALNERKYLLFRFYEATILINRPCLCETREPNPIIPLQSEHSRRMDANAAVRCISAARMLIQLLPDDVDPIGLYRTTPWWSILHYIVQAGVILIMEISYGSSHMPLETDDLISESSLVLRWLFALSETSVPAHRAWLSLSHLLRLALAKVGKHPEMSMGYIVSDAAIPLMTTTSPPIFPAPDPGFLSNQNSTPWQSQGNL